jgi:hypothetical protein
MHRVTLLLLLLVAVTLAYHDTDFYDDYYDDKYESYYHVPRHRRSYYGARTMLFEGANPSQISNLASGTLKKMAGAGANIAYKTGTACVNGVCTIYKATKDKYAKVLENPKENYLANYDDKLAAHFSNLAYYLSPVITPEIEADIGPNWNTVYNKAETKIWVNMVTRRIVLAYKGTTFDFSDASTKKQTTDDIISDLRSLVNEEFFIPHPVYTKKLIDCGTVGLGFVERFEKDKAEVTQVLSDYFNNRKFDLLITGHSLGSAVSTLATVFFSSKYDRHKHRITLINFAGPMVGDERFGTCFNKRVGTKAKRFVSVWYSSIPFKETSVDVVTLTPLQNKHIGTEVLVPCRTEPVPALRAIKCHFMGHYAAGMGMSLVPPPPDY